MKSKFYLLAVTLFLATTGYAQLDKIVELNFASVSNASVDRLGNFYFVPPSGKIQKYDPDGKLLDETSKSVLPLTLLEPWNPLNVFTYSNKTNQYQLWDHHLLLLEEKTLEPSLSISPQLVCPDNEVHKIWILDIADFTLKKANLVTNEIELDTPLPTDWASEKAEFVFIREYQNRIFILDKNKGILMLNHIGKVITSIDVKGLSFFNFLGQELCYRSNGKIQLMDLHTGETRTVAELVDPDAILFTIITDERLVVGRKGKIIFYAFHQ